MDKVQEIQLELLVEFSKVANCNGLKWFGMFGTLLGAARCGGFIALDKDIDVAMPREDYDRLGHQPELFSEPYFLQTTTNDPSAAPRFMRLRHSGTAILPENFPTVYTPGGHMGIFIDIIPLDIVPDIQVAYKLHAIAADINKKMYASAAYDEIGLSGWAPPSKIKHCNSVGGFPGLYSIYADWYEKTCSGFKEGRYYAMPVLSGAIGHRVFDREAFADTVEMSFEGVKIPAPIGWREVLAVSYPEGTYEPDPRYSKKKEPPFQGCLVDTGKSFRAYQHKYTSMLSGIEGKKVYLFGAGDSLRIWLERYSDGLDVVCCFDNSEEKWDSEAYGIAVCNPQRLPELIDDEARLIIVSMYHMEIGNQLEDMGITDYFVFIDGWKYERDNP